MRLADCGAVGAGAHALVAVYVVFVGVGVDVGVSHVGAVNGDLLAFFDDEAVGEDDGASGLTAHCYWSRVSLEFFSRHRLNYLRNAAGLYRCDSFNALSINVRFASAALVRPSAVSTLTISSLNAAT